MKPDTSAPSIVIFGGTAAYSIDVADFATVGETRVMDTPFGRSPRFFKLTTPGGSAVWFSSRHGEESLARSARFVNHRANVWAAHLLGADLILSWNGVGAVNPNLRVGDMIVPFGLMDWTRHRHHSFGRVLPALEGANQFRQQARTIDHINNGRDARQVAHPFDKVARQALKQTAAANIGNVPKAVYVCTEGPRLETAAEIALAADLGADVVGMTLCPEVWLAAELGLDYASLCLVTNFATGLWHIDSRRDFGAGAAAKALTTLLATADMLADEYSAL